MSGWALGLALAVAAMAGFDLGVLFVRWVRDGRPWWWKP